MSFQVKLHNPFIIYPINVEDIVVFQAWKAFNSDKILAIVSVAGNPQVVFLEKPQNYKFLDKKTWISLILS